MASSRLHRSGAFALLAALLLAGFWLSPAEAQQQPAGFAVDRLYQSPPGAGWFVMDDLDMTGRLGGGVGVTSGDARTPLVISGPDGPQKLAVVQEEAFLTIGAALTHDRFRG